MGSIRVKHYPVNVDSLHVGDSVWWSDRRLDVVTVNREGRRVLVGGRKKTCAKRMLRWVNECQLSTRPIAMKRRKFRSVLSLPSDMVESIEWTPTREAEPTATKPGSSEKIEALRLRVARGETLWHANDADCSGVIKGQEKPTPIMFDVELTTDTLVDNETNGLGLDGFIFMRFRELWETI